MNVSDRTISYESYRSENHDCRLLAVDAAQAVPDRRAFVRAACESEDDAEGVLFLALEQSYAEPRVVTTFVNPEGTVERVTPAAAGCAAAWAMDRISEETVLLDTQTGTYRAVADGDERSSSGNRTRSGDGEGVVVESLSEEADRTNAAVVRDESDASLAAPAPAPDGGRLGHSPRTETEPVVSEEPRPADDD